MHEIKLPLRYSYNTQVSRAKNYLNLSKPSNSSNKNHNLKIQTHALNLQPDYNLPLKQLQYTKTRKYVQNLNPIFQQLKTTQDRYVYSKSFRNEDYKNDDNEVSDRSFVRDRRKDKKVKVNQLKQRSRILSQNVKKVQLNSRVTFGQVNIPKQFKQKKDAKSASVKSVQERVKPERDHLVRRGQEQSLKGGKDKFQVSHKKMSEQQNKELSAEQQSKQYLQQIAIKVEQMRKEITQSQYKLQLLRKQVEMHKQKNLVKERQLFYLSEQSRALIKKQRQTMQELSKCSQRYLRTETKHNDTGKRLRLAKNQLHKQQNWLREENAEIAKLEKMFQQLLNSIRQLEQEEDRRQVFLDQLEEEKTINTALKMHIQHADNKLASLLEQTRVLVEETQTLQTHQRQLTSLETKFNAETQALLAAFNQLNQQLTEKQDFIEKEPQIDELIKQLELELGHVNQKKIMTAQQIQDIHVKISLKKRNIKYIQNQQPERSQFAKKPINSQFQQRSKSTINKQDQQLMSFGGYKSRPARKEQIEYKKIPLPTIRQQSKTTSAYQTPRLQKQTSDQQSQRHFESNSLQIDSRIVSQTEVLKPQKIDDKQKKYFVIQSEDDGSNVKSSVNYNLSKINSYELFVEKHHKASIQNRLDDVEDLQLRTDQQDKKSFSVELQKSDFNKHQKNIQTQQSQQINGHRDKRQPSKHQYARQIEQPARKSTSKGKIRQSTPQSSHQSEENLDLLIQQYNQIKSNSCFGDSWRHRI